MIESIDATMIALFSREVLDTLYGHLQTTYSIEKAQVPYRLETLFAILKKTFWRPVRSLYPKPSLERFYFKLGLEFTDNPNHTLLEYVDEAKTKLESSATK